MQDLEAHLSNFESVIAARLPYYISGSPIARAIREIYATRSASAVLSCVRRAFAETVDIALTPSQPDDPLRLQPVLPALDAVQRATPRLVRAVALRNRAEAIEALEEMGVFALCVSLDRQFSRLEWRVGSTVGRVRLIPLVELAILAAELDSYDKASIYVAEAQALTPSPPELHDLHSVAGVIALNSGNLDEATEHLAESVRVCQRGGFARVACCVRRQNLMLADKLLDQGHARIVTAHLAQCMAIWKHDTKRIGGWIEGIQAGKRPDLSEPGGILWSRPEQRMTNLIMQGMFFSETPPVESADRGSLPTEEEMREEIHDEYR
jgi:hypothetical protein